MHFFAILTLKHCYQYDMMNVQEPNFTLNSIDNAVHFIHYTTKNSNLHNRY